MVELVIAAVAGGLVGACATVAWQRRKGSEGAARERRSGGAAAALQRSILDSLQDGVVVYDEDDRIMFFNPAAAEILGVRVETLRRWEAEGKLRTERTQGRQRRVPASEVARLLAETSTSDSCSRGEEAKPW